MLLVLAGREGIEETCLQTEMEWQQEIESGTDTDAVQEELRITQRACPLLMLRITDFQTVLHAEMVLLLLHLLFGGVKKGVVGDLEIRRMFVLRLRAHESKQTQCDYDYSFTFHC